MIFHRRPFADFFDHKHIVAGTFSHIPLVIQHERFHATAVLGFDLRHDVIEIIQAFDRGIDRFGKIPYCRDRDDLEALLVETFRIKCDLIRDDEDGGLFAKPWGKSKITHPARHHHANVGIHQVVLPERFDDR